MQSLPPLPGLTVRRAERHEYKEIEAKLRSLSREDHVTGLHGRDINALQMIEQSPLSLIGFEDNEMVGFMAVSSTVPSHVLMDLGEGRLDAHFGFGPEEESDAKFLRVLWAKDRRCDFLYQSLREVFKAFPSTRSVACLCPVMASNEGRRLMELIDDRFRPTNERDHYRSSVHARKSFFDQVPRRQDSTCSSDLYVCDRSRIVVPLQVRKAAIEDCDDILGILHPNAVGEASTESVLLSQLIESNESDQALSLVATSCDRIVGFMHFISNASTPPNLIMEYHVKPEIVADVSNPISIHLFCILPEFADETFKLLDMGFSSLQSTLCFISVPTVAPSFPLLEHFQFLPKKFPNGDQQSLYLSTPAMLTPLSVTHSPTLPSPQVQDGVSQSVQLEIFLDKTRIGTMHLVPRVHNLHEQFDLEDFVSRSPDAQYVHLENFSLDAPVSDYQLRILLDKAMSLSSVQAIVWNGDAKCAEMTMIRKVFFPCRRRRQIQFPGNMKDGKLVDASLPNNLWISSLHLVSSTRCTILRRIVIIGASDCGISAALQLVHDPRNCFLNVTLVSRSAPVGGFINTTSAFPPEELAKGNLRQGVHFIDGDAVKIDRSLQVVELQDGKQIGYDLLILATGTQYNFTNLSPKLKLLGNTFNVNSDELDQLETALGVPPKDGATKVVVYGSSMPSLTFVAHLEGKGFDASSIVLVLPDSQFDEVPYLSSEDKSVVQRLLVDPLSARGVTVKRDSEVTYWEATDGMLSALKTSNEDGDFTVDRVQALFYAHRKSVKAHTFQMVNDASLSFDGQLVVDEQFRTVDPLIWGVGPGTKFSSKLARKWAHSSLNSKELGCKLAESVVSWAKDQSVDLSALQIQQFQAPKIFTAKMPGGLTFLTFAHPCCSNAELKDLTQSQGQSKYFRVSVQQGYIRSMCYIGPEAPTENYIALCNIHERLCNNLVSRFEEGLIPDFASYFAQENLLTLFSDRLPGFLAMVKDELQLQDQRPKELVDGLENERKGEHLTSESLQTIYTAVDRSSFRQFFDGLVFKYVRENVWNTVPPM